MAWALACTQYHRSFSPSQPRWNGPQRFWSHMLMDDSVLIEPVIGERAALSAQAYEQGVRTLLGPSSINEEKNEVEGKFCDRLTCWGLTFDTQRHEVSIPEQRILKGAYLLAEPKFDAGNRELTLRDVQKVRGTVQSWLAALPGLRTELKSIDAFMCAPEPDCLVSPREDIADPEEAWNELWLTFEVLRLLCARPEVWGSRYTVGLSELLSLQEQLELPQMRDRVRVVSSDATLDKRAAVDWSSKTTAQHLVTPFTLHLAREGFEEDVRISIAELLGYVSFAATRAEDWEGSLIVYAGDNQNVVCWLKSRAPRPAMAQKIVRVLNMLEARHKFRTHAVYLRTYHNRTPDLYSRCSYDEFVSHAGQAGLEVVSSTLPWEEAVKATKENRAFIALGLDPEDQKLALQLRERRMQRQVPCSLSPLAVLVAFRGKTLDWALTWSHLGGVALAMEPRSSALLGWCGGQTEKLPPKAWVAYTFTADPTGKDLAQFAATVHQAGGEGLIAEGPECQPIDRMCRVLEMYGWQYRVETFSSCELGLPVARNRRAIWASGGFALQASLAEMGL
eukprot:4280033-Amphidinium_carterae.1